MKKILTIIILAAHCQNFCLTLTSSSFKNSGQIPRKFTCFGDNISPQLEWKNVPTNAKSLVLVMKDIDAPNKNFIHWIVFNINPASKHLLASASRILRDNNIPQGKNSFGKIAYDGPCPPAGKAHRYHFNLFALDKKLDQKGGITIDQLFKVMQDHVIDKTNYVGLFTRP